MADQPLLKVMRQLIGIHDSLLQVSVRKSELLKANDMEAINELLKIEQKHVQALEKLERLRQVETKQLAKTLAIEEDAPSVSLLIERLPEEQVKQDLEAEATQLAALILAIKQQEDLNQQLLKQSLQFVQLQMDLVKPTIDSFNYGTQKQAHDPEQKRSVFDSKA
ncbi:FlgN protein [Streptohalobacillus salinus]|uniref:FlgN protein n=1 Tax=Streptohalobacillus salinus TaxID=621096 RepID=A0A2V3WDN0_9BACI|nr:flagellar protein FlgN [Streptohalobacillus salinus]PXW93010.1 FlgN protein [Streptohalobacillus salinus]